MSPVLPNSFYDNNNSQLVNVSMLVEKPCPPLVPFIIPHFYGSPAGWNAVLVGLLSCILAIIFLLTCLYYLICRRRYFNELCDSPTSVPLVDKNGSSSIPVTSSSQMATTTFINEPHKETKITFTEQKTGITTGEFIGGMPTMGNGHTSSTSTNGLLANSSADPSELRLLQHEHH